MTVLTRSNIEIVASNPTQGIDVCIVCLCVCRSCDGLNPRPRCPTYGAYDKKIKKRPKSTRAVKT
jgi:hypothetical protein